jgi:hypothetical protein
VGEALAFSSCSNPPDFEDEDEHDDEDETAVFTHF